MAEQEDVVGAYSCSCSSFLDCCSRNLPSKWTPSLNSKSAFTRADASQLLQCNGPDSQPNRKFLYGVNRHHDACSNSRSSRSNRRSSRSNHPANRHTSNGIRKHQQRLFPYLVNNSRLDHRGSCRAAFVLGEKPQERAWKRRPNLKGTFPHFSQPTLSNENVRASGDPLCKAI